MGRLNFKSPGFLKVKKVDETMFRHSGISTMVADMIVRLDEQSEQLFNDSIRKRVNNFIEQNEERIMSCPDGQILGDYITVFLESSEGDMFIKSFVGAERADDELHIYSILVHSEEMDILLQCSWGDQYDELYGAM